MMILTSLLAALFLSSAASAQDICAQFETTPDFVSVHDGAWSDPDTWGGAVPGMDSSVYISTDVTADDAVAGLVKVGGSLNVSGVLRLSGSLVVCHSGSLTGSEGVIAFSVADDREFSGNDFPGPVAGYPDFYHADVGLWNFGHVDIRAPEVTSWLDVVPKAGSEPLAFGINRSVAISSGSAILASEPTGWRVGDKIVLTTEQGEYAVTELTSINGTAITYQESGLVGYLLEKNGQTIAPKIGNLSRRFQIISDDVTEGDPNHRAHTIHMGGAVVRIENVEFRNLGPRQKVGRYPVHFHLGGSGSVSGSSIWQDVNDPGNRWVSIHSTSGVTIDSNVMLRSMGSGILYETRDTFGNATTNNLMIDLHHIDDSAVVDGYNRAIYEEIRIEDEFLFLLASPFPNYVWGRQGNDMSGNVAVGQVTDQATNKFGHVNGIGIFPGDSEVDTVVSDFTCLGAGGFCAWSHVDGELSSFDGLRAAYSTVAGWYPTLGPVELSNSLLLMNGEETNVFAGQIFSNQNGGYVVSAKDSTLAGGFGFHNHYFSLMDNDNLVIDVACVVDPTHWETPIKIRNSAITVTDQIFCGRPYPGNKKASPSPVWFENTTINGQDGSGVWVRQLDHSRFFSSIGNPVFTGVAVEYEPALFLQPNPVGLGQWHGKYWTITPNDGSPEAGKASKISINIENLYGQSVAGGFDGYPWGVPQGEYVVRYYEGIAKTGFLLEETVTVGDPQPVDEHPTAVITTTETVYPDTDWLPGESVTLACTVSDDNGTPGVEWLVDDSLAGLDTDITIFLDDGPHSAICRATDSANQQAQDTVSFIVEAPPAPDWEQRFYDLLDAIQQVIDDAD